MCKDRSESIRMVTESTWKIADPVIPQGVEIGRRPGVDNIGITPIVPYHLSHLLENLVHETTHVAYHGPHSHLKNINIILHAIEECFSNIVNVQ